MNKIFTALLPLVFVITAYGQKTTVTKSEQAALDSMLKNDPLLDMLKDKGSYFDISIGVGNRLFSVRNNSVNASQSQTNKLFYTPSVAYHHKSGLGLSVTPYLASDSGSFKVFQTGITPSYDYSNEKWGAGISYTRYVADNTKFNSNSIFQNDFYTYVKILKWAIQPGFALGYTTGKYKEINTVLFTPPPPLPQVPRLVKDSTSNNAKDFTMTVSAEHVFNFENLFSKKDGLAFTPQLMLTAGSEKLTINHLNKAYAKLVANSQRLKKRGTTQNGSSSFAAQSVGLSIDFLYSIGKFFLQPNTYFDYYLPSTTDKRLTTFFSITAGVSF